MTSSVFNPASRAFRNKRKVRRHRPTWAPSRTAQGHCGFFFWWRSLASALGGLAHDPTFADDLPARNGLVLGSILGIVDLVDCVAIEDLPAACPELHARAGRFASGPFVFVLAHPRKLATPIPATGSLNLWHVDPPAELQSLAEVNA